MGGGMALFAANTGASLAFPLAKDCNNRKIPEVIESLKALPQADHLLLHPILAEAMYENYGKTNSPELDELRRLDMVQTGGGKLAESVAEKLIALGVNIVSFQQNTYEKVNVRHFLMHLDIYRGLKLEALKLAHSL